MNIAGIQQSSLLDYPGKITCIVFTPGCNFRCHFCHNPELVLPEQMKLFQNDAIPEDSFFNFLKGRKGLLDGVTICGGEPTLQPDLLEFAEKVKKMGFLVKLDTNGRDYAIVEKLIQQKLVDYVAIDLKHVPAFYEKAVGLPQTNDFFQNYEKILELLRTGDVAYEYRTTVVKGMHTLADIEKMAEYIQGVDHYYLQNYIGGNSLNPDFGGESFTDDELLDLQVVASRYVKHCGVRK